MKKASRKFTTKLKAQVAIAALQERESLAELAKRYELHPNRFRSESGSLLRVQSEPLEILSPRLKSHRRRT